MPTLSPRGAAYFARRMRKGRQDPFFRLAGTHNLGVAAATVTTATVFPDRTLPVTFSTRVEVTGASAAGIIFEFGSATNGVKLAISGGSLYFAAGNATSAADDGVDGDVALPALDETGSVLDIVVAVRPGTGQARVWVGGALVLRLDAAAATPMLDGEWADDENGAVGAAHATGSTQRIGATVNGAPSDFRLTAPLRVAMGQTPRQFD